VKKTIDKVQARLNGKGRVLVRYSGTEPVVRILVEGENQDLIQTLAEDIAQSFRRALA